MEQLNAFIEKAKSDNELTEKLNTLGQKGAGSDEYITLAAGYGFTITAEELDENIKHKELNEEQLEEVAGGIAEVKSANCWFKPGGEKKVHNGHLWLKCSAWSCWSVIKTYCSCYGESQCKDGWHKLMFDIEPSYLYDVDYYNHSLKHPPTYDDD